MSATGNPPCVNNCGFFGSPATRNMCSSCYKTYLAANPHMQPPPPQPQPQPQPQQPQQPTPQPPADPPLPADPAPPAQQSSPPQHPPQKNRRRCFKCNKKVGFLGFDCVCDRTFCSDHRHAEQHDCHFDFRARQREQLAKDNPTVKASKVHRL